MTDSNARWFESDGADVLVRVHVVPNASRTSIVGLLGDRIKVRVAAAPERGRANDAVCRALIASTGASGAEVVAGHGHRHKTVRLRNVTASAVRAVGEIGG